MVQPYELDIALEEQKTGLDDLTMSDAERVLYPQYLERMINLGTG